MVDIAGKVVAINTATVPLADGIGFAIPINTVLNIARQIIEHGQVRRPWLGIVGYDVNRRVAQRYGLRSSRGVLVVDVTLESPADTAGLQVGDVVLSIQEEEVASVGDLVDVLKSKKIGDEVNLEVERHGKILKTKANLGTRPF